MKAGNAKKIPDASEMEIEELREHVARDLMRLDGMLEGFRWARQRNPDSQAEQLADQVRTWLDFVRADMDQEPDNRSILLLEYGKLLAGFRMLCIYYGMEPD